MAFLDETGLAELWALIKAEDEKVDRFELLFETAINQTHNTTSGGYDAEATQLISATDFRNVLASGYDEIYLYFNGTINVTSTTTDMGGGGSISYYKSSSKNNRSSLFNVGSGGGQPNPNTASFNECIVFRKGLPGGTDWYMPNGFSSTIDTSRTLGLLTTYAKATYTGTFRVYGRKVGV